MEPALIIKTSFVLMTITALGGVVMAIVRLGRAVNPPSWLAMLHGLLAGAALTLLLYAYFTIGLPQFAAWALLVFLVAALGGVYLNLGFHVPARLMPATIVVVHAVISVAGYVLLLMAVLGKG
jgi:hypothetical protein